MQYVLWKMKISIITCTYNSESTIEKCIDSVFSQWFKDNEYEHIFVDAHSKDTTIDIIKQKYHDKHNYKIISAEPKWAYNAMNLWIKEATWTYIYLLNSDDCIYQQWLSEILSYAVENKYDFCFGNARYVDEKNTLLRTLEPKKYYPWFLKRKLYKMPLYIFHYDCPQATVYKKVIHEALWMYNETYKLLSDREFSIKVSQSEYKTQYVDIDVCDFLVHELSLTSNKNNLTKMYKEWTMIINEYFWYGLGNIRTGMVKLIKIILWIFHK